MIQILRTGTRVSFADMGRFGYRRFGVPIGGAMDRHSALRANSLIDNQPNDPVLELYLAGHHLLFEKSMTIALAGAETELFVNDKRCNPNAVLRLDKGSSLQIGKFIRGALLYLTVPGGFKCKKVLGSCSPLPPYLDNNLKRGDVLSVSETKVSHHPQNASLAEINLDKSQSIKVFPGPEWEWLDEQSRQRIQETSYRISLQSNFMGFRLEGEMLTGQHHGMYSTAVMPGTVQMLPNGQPVVLMRHCQTTGGYPRILQLDPNSIDVLSQRKPLESVEFELVLSD